MKFIDKAMTEPRHLVQPSAWAGHIPFAMWLISVLRPKTFVELGTYTGNSYLSFCQAVEQEQTGTICYAVDTWKGDKHGGFYDEGIFELIKAAHDPFYSTFSSLMRMTFDEAVEKFEDHTIDLLHIDGLHTYEAVKHDFETWFPKLSNNAVVLFHDINVFRDDFGAHWFWYETNKYYPHFSFTHCNGLGVLLVGKNRNDILLSLCEDNQYAHEKNKEKKIFQCLGRRLEQFLESKLLESQTEEKINLLKKENKILIEQLKDESKSNNIRINKLHKENKIIKDNQLSLENKIHELAISNQHQSDELEKYEKMWFINTIKNLDKIKQKISSANRYRNLFRKLIKEKGSIGKAYQTCRRIYKSSDFQTVKNFLKNPCIEQNINKVHHPFNIKDGLIILCTQHTYYVAKLLAQNLNKIKISAQIIFEMPEKGYSDKWHIVICPQMFKTMPNHYVAFQMEQSVSNRWFTKNYLEYLEHAEFIFDYSISNIKFFRKNYDSIEFKKLYYLPIGTLDTDNTTSPNEFEYDVVFYGDANCERRKFFLSKLQENFSVKIISEVFGEELYSVLKKAKVVVNIHYYENALLETTRIYESLSLNKLIISEIGSDQENHKELNGIVDFVDVGDINIMIDKINYWLNNQKEFLTRLNKIQEFRKQPNKFQFYFYRFLLSQDLLDFDTFYEFCADYVKPVGDFWCLSLPETPFRQENFLNDNHYGAWIFPGLRHNIGWIGCALSYKFMLKIAENLELPQVTICEDDVFFKKQFEQRYIEIKRLLSQSNENWDIFSGLVSDLSENSDLMVSSIQSNNETLYRISHLVSMVFNIYNQKAYSKIYSWNSNIRTTDNTIDRYIEKHGGINGLVVFPFLVGHKEDLFSTLWGIQNNEYNKLIEKSEYLLDRKIHNVPKTLLIEILTKNITCDNLNNLGETFSNIIIENLKKTKLTDDNPEYVLHISPYRFSMQVKNVHTIQANQNTFFEKSFNDEVNNAPIKLLDILDNALEEAVEKLSITEETIQNLMVLHGSSVLPTRILGLLSNNTTLGHRLSNTLVSIGNADFYTEQLKNKGKVITSFLERKEIIERSLYQAALRLNAKAIFETITINKISISVEWPSVLEANFDAHFLEIPQECLIIAIQQNIRCFPLLDMNGNLMNRFLIISDLESTDSAQVIYDYECSLHALLKDAEFLYQQKLTKIQRNGENK